MKVKCVEHKLQGPAWSDSGNPECPGLSHFLQCMHTEGRSVGTVMKFTATEVRPPRVKSYLHHLLDM